MTLSQDITDIMGLSIQVQTISELNEMIIQGIPKSCLTKTVSHLSSNTKVKKDLHDRIVPASTFKRRKTVLNAQEGERVARIARIYLEALDIWGNQEETQEFLFHPHPLLENKRPIDMAFTSLGAIIVEQVFDKIRYGLPV